MAEFNYPFFHRQPPLDYSPVQEGLEWVVMNGEKPARRSTKLSNWMIAAGLTVVALAAYAVIAVHIHTHGIN